MRSLTIHLQDGFENDRVIIRVNNREVFSGQAVRTKLLLGYADSFAVETPGPHARIEVLVPSRNLSETLELEIPDGLHLGLSIVGQKIEHRTAGAPFGYM